MTTIDERIKTAKKDALTIFLEGEYWHKITYEKWEEAYLKSLNEEKARQEKNEQNSPIQHSEIVNGQMIFTQLCPSCLRALKSETDCKYCGWMVNSVKRK